jgi:heptosyltransferase-2
MSEPPPSGDPRRLVVLAPNWLGDAVMALPAIADVRRHFAGAHLTVAGRGAIAALFAMVPGIDAVLTLPGRGGLAALRTWRADAGALAAAGFDTALLLPNSFASALVAHRAGIGERWGLATDLRGRLLTQAVPKPRSAESQAAYYQALVGAFGIANGPRHARVDPPRLEQSPAPRDPYVVFAPGAAYGKAKQWPPPRFGELAVRLLAEKRSVALVGSRGDQDACSEIVRTVRRLRAGADEGVVDLCGRTTLGELASVMAGAEGVVSNDSGAMHLAAAVGAPVVAVFGATNERRTAPLTRGPDAPRPRVVATDVWCRPCMLRECPIDHRCMTGVSAGQVHEALRAVAS